MTAIRRLVDHRRAMLRAWSPECAALVDVVAPTLKPEATPLPRANLELTLLDHLERIAHQSPAALPGFAYWLNLMVLYGALTEDQAEAFEAAALPLAGSQEGV